MEKNIKRYAKIILPILATIILTYAIIYIDVVLRAREAYLEGEKYWSWHHNPQLKEQMLSAEFEKEKNKLEKDKNPSIISRILFGKKPLTEEEYNLHLEALKFEYERKKKESAIKYAYVWYQTAVELFSPPESKYVKLARQKMPLAKELWKEELRRKGVPFEEYMLE
jgi:hypothetical protein